MQSYEKLGAFYLGKQYDTTQGSMADELYLYDSRDLVTHAVCVGMTGSGKTGLCVTLIEEAAIDGVPAIVIDPKGDLTNLLLTFPDLSGASFKPWVNEDAARTKGMTVDAFASAQANLWKKGLADWGQDGARIQRLKDAADFAVYTPGSTAATPVSILSTLEAPAVTDDIEVLADRATTTSSSLLGLLGVGDDNLTSREHVLLSNILIESWRSGDTMDLAGLIRAIQSPPISRIGVLELESFYPSKDRFELAMRFNSLLASPRFATWLDGAPLDVDRFLFSESGKPRVSIFSIAHLDDAERMFFVSLLLNETLAWMRTRPGTSSLRALLYMDEIFGYLPPVANPPSKRPLLTMLKQARAHGLGLVLATQNPADIDYKALSNAGTWFIGRLQTERDKQRLLAGLQSTGSEQGEDLEGIIANLGKRVFLARNVHEQGETTFHTRWAMSYLAGPMTRDQLKRVTAGDAASATPAAPRTAKNRAAAAAPAGAPMLSTDIPQWYLDAPAAAGSLTYRPAVVGIAEVRMKRRGGSDEIVERVGSVVPLGANTRTPDWDDSVRNDVTVDELREGPIGGAAFAPLPAAATSAKSYVKWKKEFSDQLYRTVRSTIYRSKAFKMTSEVGESERDFRIRLGDKAREVRDEAVEKLRKRFATKFQRMDERIRRAEQRIGREKDDVKAAKMSTAVSLGATLLSAFLGRKTVSAGSVGKASTTLRGAGRTARQASDVKRAQQTLEDLQLKRQELADQFDEEVDTLEDRFDAQMENLVETEIKPRRTDIHVETLALLWIPSAR